MDEEYHCKARPNMSSTGFDANNISSHPHDKYFRIEFDYTKILVQTDANHRSVEYIERHTLREVSMDKLMEETTIPSWLSHIKIPKEYFVLVAEEVSRCARDMVNGTYKNIRFLCIRVDFSLTIPLEEDEEEIEVEEEDNGLALETYEEAYEVYFEDDCRGYQWNDRLEEDEEQMEVEEEDDYEDDYGGYQWEEVEEEMEVEEEDDSEVYYEDDFGGYDLEEDEEEMEVEEVDNRFVPVAKSFIEGLKVVKVEEVEKCAICFEDFNVGVRIPCTHMFHMTCIRDWLVIGNSCPLCRFQLPT